MLVLEIHASRPDTSPRPKLSTRGRSNIGAAAVLALGLLGCGLTDVSAPDVVEPESLDNPAGALIRRAGAIARFATGFSNQALYSGVLADEFIDLSGGFLVSDQRTISDRDPNTYPYGTLSDARINTLRAIETLQEYNPDPPARVGEMYALLGYTELFFAENLCSGVPLGTLSNGIPAIGPILTSDEMLALALAHFDTAAALAAADPDILNLVRVGRGRALLYGDAPAAAAAAVSEVPAEYAYAVEFSPSVQPQNAISARFADRWISVADEEGVNGLPFVSANDPRLPTVVEGPGRAGGTVYRPAFYSSLGSPIILASGTEAALIRAEAALRSGDADGWAAILNDLRTDAGMTPLPAALTTDADPATRVDVHFRERAFWLFGSGHRHADLRRLVRQHGRAVDDVFPTGFYQDSGETYGQDVVFVPFGEGANPSFEGCFSRAP